MKSITGHIRSARPEVYGLRELPSKTTLQGLYPQEIPTTWKRINEYLERVSYEGRRIAN